MASSEVAKIRQQIDLEIEAANRALHAPAVVANHAAITAKMENVTEQIRFLFKSGREKEAKALLESDDLWN